ncbi:hypothetical protein LCGC14_0783480 [marine sediment metagenome]|uniref:Uncharacterized protein n=1 Tax=marine sediment metagenome TaxID=412755 RepID=A0A0F9PUZ9_9ZZZZ
MKAKILILILLVAGCVWGKTNINIIWPRTKKTEDKYIMSVDLNDRHWGFEATSNRWVEVTLFNNKKRCFTYEDFKKRLGFEVESNSVPKKIDALDYVSGELKAQAKKNYKKGADIAEDWAKHKWVVTKIKGSGPGGITDNFWTFKCNHCERIEVILDDYVLSRKFLTRYQIDRLRSLGVISGRIHKNVLEAK